MRAENILPQWFSCEQPEVVVVAADCPSLSPLPTTTPEGELVTYYGDPSCILCRVAKNPTEYSIGRLQPGMYMITCPFSKDKYQYFTISGRFWNHTDLTLNGKFW